MGKESDGLEDFHDKDRVMTVPAIRLIFTLHEAQQNDNRPQVLQAAVSLRLH